MLYWTVRWRSIAWLSLAVFVLGLGNVGKYFRPQWGKTYEQPREEGTIRILSYNVGGFWGNTVGKPESKMRAIAEYIRAEDPDVVCMQEYEVNYINRRPVLDSLLEPLKYKAVYFAQTIRDNGGWGIAVYSKYPIVGKDHMVFPESQNSAMWVDIAVRKDTIRVFNNHLQTTQIDENDRKFLRTEPMSYTYRRMRGDFVDAFKRKGHGMVFTYRRLMGVLRIDYLFHSDDFETVSYRSEQPEWSDHNPVIVDVRLKRD